MGIKMPRFVVFWTTSTIKDNKKASIRWQDSATPISGYWPTSEPNFRLVTQDDNFRKFISILRTLGRRRTLVDGSLESTCRVLLSVIELLFLSLTVEALQGKMCQNSLPSEGGRSLGAKNSGEGVIPLPIYWYHSKGNWLHYNFATDSCQTSLTTG